MLDIDLTFSQESIDNAAKQIEAYRDSIERKNAEFISKLADLGISVAQNSTASPEYASYVTFSKKIYASKEGRARGKVSGKSPQVLVEWEVNGEAWVSPILMVEFGSGAKASDASGKPNAQKATELGYGRGTFPGQTHAFEERWHWQDKKGRWHTSSGVEPDMPMWRAAREMRMEIARVARQVFNS